MKKICMIGAQYNSANNGVNALTAGCMKLFLENFRNVQFSIVDFAKNNHSKNIKIDMVNHTVPLKALKLRFTTSFLKNNIFSVLLFAMLWNFFNRIGIPLKFLLRNSILKEVIESDLCISISGGDSFSDIYGMHRFYCVTLPLLLPLLCDKKLVLMPQTYGPFNRRMAKLLSKYILSRSKLVYARDYTSLEELKKHLNKKKLPENFRFCYDVAFAINSEKPLHYKNLNIFSRKGRSEVFVGLNISGLLYRGGYTKNNMFGLKSSYQEIIDGCINTLLAKPECNILLIPHVFGDSNHFESDVSACRKVFAEYSPKANNRIQIVQGHFDAFEIKYIIGQCDFFIGSRMHACIAALSQGIPAVGIAYSKKFIGLYETLSCEDLVTNAYAKDVDSIIGTVNNAYNNLEVHAEQLKSNIIKIPAIHKELFKYY